MIYNILGIIIGIFTFINSIFLIVSKKEKQFVCIINFVLALGFIGTGIGGFFIPEKLEYITIILLLIFAVLFLVQYYVFLKKGQASKNHKITSSKK
ncbi:MAG: hypothetical protein NC310_06340 [Roseburia sp.]|nr:hypothetical protein [Roseburia sp.]MCM1557497.1 hypothetical protein [Anaeroplasma bactoclasticum]